MVYCEQCELWHGNSHAAHRDTGMSPIKRARLRGFVSMLATYPQTMKNKHIRVAMRAYCEAHGLDQAEAREVTRDITAI